MIKAKVDMCRTSSHQAEIEGCPELVTQELEFLVEGILSVVYTEMLEGGAYHKMQTLYDIQNRMQKAIYETLAECIERHERQMQLTGARW